MMRRKSAIWLLGLLLGGLVLTSKWQVWSGTRVCLECHGSQQVRLRSLALFLYPFHTTVVDGERLSEFVRAFPEYTCNHFWGRYTGQVVFALGSPFLTYGPPTGRTTVSELQQQYAASPEFRRRLHALMDAGTITRQKILAVAASNCMDGGVCQLWASTNREDRVLLELMAENNPKLMIPSRWVEPASPRPAAHP